jgi:hypothetical protein
LNAQDCGSGTYRWLSRLARRDIDFDAVAHNSCDKLPAGAFDQMKKQVKDRKTNGNGTPITRKELLEAQERSLKHDENMTTREGFASLVLAGIITKRGKLSTSYGG